MKRALMITGSILGLGVAGLAAAPFFIDPSVYKQQALDAVQAATGYDVRVDGPISLSLLPVPSVTIKDIQIKRPDGAADDYLAKVRALSASVSIWPLLSGQVVVSSLSADGMDARVIFDEQGQPNWITPVLSEKMSPQKDAAGTSPASVSEQASNNVVSSGSAVKIQNIRVKDSHLLIEHKGQGRSFDLADLDLAASMDDMTGPFDVRFSSMINGLPVDVRASSSQIESGKDADVRAKVQVGDDNTLSFDGSVSLRAGYDVKGVLDINANKPSDIGALAGASLSLPAFKGQAQIALTPLNIVADPIKLDVGGQSLKGTVKFRMADSDFKKPLLYARLSGDGLIDLRSALQSSSSAKNVSGASSVSKGNSAPTQTIPAVPSFPVDMDVDVALAGVQMGKTPFEGVRVTLNAAGDTVKGTMAIAKVPGQGQLTLAAVPTSGQDMTFRLDGRIVNVSAFIADGLDIKGMDDYTRSVRDLVMGGTVSMTSSGVSMRDTAVKWTGGNISLSGTSYMWSGKRPKLNLALAGQSLRMSDFMPAASSGTNGAQLTGTESNAGVKNTADLEKTVSQSLASLKLPMDVTFSVALQSLALPDMTIRDVAARGSITQTAVAIDTFSVGDLYGASLSVRGKIDDLTGTPRADMAIQVAAQNPAAVLQKFAPDIPKNDLLNHPLRLNASYQGTIGAGRVDSAVDINNVKLGLSGPVKGALTKQPQLSDMQVSVKAQKAQYIADLMGVKNQSPVLAEPADLSAGIGMNGGQYKASNIRGTLGKTQVSGEMDFDTSKSVPKIAGSLNIGDLPLDAWMGVSSPAAAGGNIPVNAQSVTTSKKVKIDTAAFRSMNIDMMIAAKKITYQLWSLSDPSLSVNLQDGVLNIKDARADVFGGSVKGNVRVDAKKENAPITIVSNGVLSGVNARSASNALMGAAYNRFDGIMGMTFDIQTSAVYTDEILSGLSGQVQTSGQNIAVNGIDAAKLAGWLTTDLKPSNAIENLQASVLSGGSTKFDTHKGVFDIQKGQVKLTDVSMTGADADLIATGNMDLPRWMMDARATFKVKNPSDAPPLELALKGPIGNPARSVMDGMFTNYVQGKLQKRVNRLIEKKLGGKLEKLGLGGLLGNDASGGGAAPVPAAPTAPDAGVPAPSVPQIDGAAPVMIAPPQTESVPEVQDPPKKITPEDVLLDVIKGL